MHEFNLMQKIAVWAIPVLFAITVHETAHGWVARRLGDPTAMMLGRLTLNPVKHIDPIGTILVPLAVVMLTGFVFGWARPVPITWENLRDPKRDMIAVAAAGPLANLLMVLIWTVVVAIGVQLESMSGVGLFLKSVGVAGIFANLILMLLNLLPIPPLDGGRVVAGLLPARLAEPFGRIEPYGLMILVVLLATGILGYVLAQPLIFSLGALTQLVGLSGNQLVEVLFALGGRELAQILFSF